MNDDWFKLIGIPVAAVAVAGQVQAAEYLTVEQAQKLMFGESASFEKSDIKIKMVEMKGDDSITAL